MAKHRKNYPLRTLRQKIVSNRIVKRLFVPKAKAHRSFRHSRRRDYVRQLELPGYAAITAEVVRTMLAHKRVFIGLVLLYAFLIIIFGGLSSQDIYSEMNEFAGEESLTPIGMVGQAALAALMGFSSASTEMSGAQQVYLGIAIVLTWLSTVWLLREMMAGRSPKMRDGLYNSGSPIVATAILVIVALIQLLPLGVLAVAYGGLVQVGLATEGFGAMLFFAIAVLVCALCLYWLTATFIALVIVTLPGMYPVRALKMAGDMVTGRRLRVMYRLVWLIMLLAVVGMVVMTPLVLLNNWLQSLADWVAMIPLLSMAYALMSSLITVLAASYIYLLYRKVVAYDARTGR